MKKHQVDNFCLCVKEYLTEFLFYSCYFEDENCCNFYLRATAASEGYNIFNVALWQEKVRYPLCLQGMEQAAMVIVTNNIPCSNNQEYHNAQRNNDPI